MIPKTAFSQKIEDCHHPRSLPGGMRNGARVLLLFLLCVVGPVAVHQEASAQHVVVTFQLFYDELAPYGYWVDYPRYGYVWIPNAGAEFDPYVTGGHWIYTEYGWTWVSDYPWGWAAFHYGRWHYDEVYGWMWIPGTEWGPAWVVWRRTDGYFGWCPMEPGLTIKAAFGGGFKAPATRWVFVKDNDITKVNIHRYAIDRGQNTAIFDKSHVIENSRTDNARHVTYLPGPDRSDVQKITKEKIPQLAVQESDKPGHDLSNDHLRIYRPNVQPQTDRKPAPAKVMKLEEMKRTGHKENDEKAPPKKKDKDESEVRSRLLSGVEKCYSARTVDVP